MNFNSFYFKETNNKNVGYKIMNYDGEILNIN